MKSAQQLMNVKRRRRIRTREAAPQTIREALRVAGERELDPVAVRSYMEAQRRRFSSPDWWIGLMRRCEAARPVAFNVICAVAFAGLLAVLGGAVTAFLDWRAGLVALAIGGGLFGLAALAAYATELLVCREAVWSPLPIRDFLLNRAGPVPEELALIAGEVERRVPGVWLEVIQLVVNRVVVDPVLVARCRGETCYLLVWDEEGTVVPLPAAA